MLRMPLSVKSRFRKWDVKPGTGPGEVTLLSGTCVNCGWFKAFKASQRNSNRFRSAIWKDLERLRSKLLIPPVRSVLRPTVVSLGGRSSLLWIQCTSAGVTHTSVSRLRYPVAQFWNRTARLLRGALGLIMSGREAPVEFRTVNGAPD